MSVLDSLLDWLQNNPPEEMPFFPNAGVTGRVAPRRDREILKAGASPLHLGVDRAGGETLIMPFDGEMTWHRVDAVAGSVLYLYPSGQDWLIQVFHTTIGYPSTVEAYRHLTKGEVLPVRPGDLGLSAGVHTHTEVLFPYDKRMRDWVIDDVSPIVYAGKADERCIEAHCTAYGLNFESFYADVRQQIKHWGIRDYWPRAAIRYALPEYRMPPWEGKTLHVDSMWLFQI